MSKWLANPQLLFIRALSSVLRLPWVKGRVTISEFFYRLISPESNIVEMRVNNLPLLVDLSQQESRYIYFGAFERNEVQFISRWVKPGNIAVDVGANIGYISAILAGAVGSSGKVYAFEPNPVVFAQLKFLAGASKGKIEAFHSAVTDETDNETTVTRFYISSDHPMWSSTIAEYAGSGCGEIDVPAISLSEFFCRKEIARVDFVKIDVEGGEPGVLRGMNRFLTTGARPTIMCEVAAEVGHIRGQSLAAVKILLQDFDYRAFRIAKRGNLTPLPLKEIERQTNTVNLVFLPASVRSDDMQIDPRGGNDR